MTPVSPVEATLALSARIEELKAELAQANLAYETEAKWRKAYQEAKGKMYEAGGELATWAVDNMPCNESQVDAWFRKEYVPREAYERLESQIAARIDQNEKQIRIHSQNTREWKEALDTAQSKLAAAQQQAAESAALAERMREAASKIRHWHCWGENNEGMVVSAASVHALWEAARLTPTAALAQYRDRVLEEVANHFDDNEEHSSSWRVAAEIRAMKGTK